MALEFRERRSPNYDQRSRAIDLVVLHYTGMQDAETALARLTDPEPKAGRYPGPWQAHDTDPNAPLGTVIETVLVLSRPPLSVTLSLTEYVPAAL